MPKFVSWLERAINEMPQAKASAQQWMAGLKKSPLVSMNEVEDRGLDEFLVGDYSPGSGTISREQIQGWLAEQGLPVGERTDPMPRFQDYGTPGLSNYREMVTAHPGSESRYMSPHFTDVQGYKFHERGGVIPQSNFGKAQVLDEVQTDVKRGDWAERWDPNITANEEDSTKRIADAYNAPLNALENSGLMPEGDLTARTVVHPDWYTRNTPEEAAEALESVRSYLTDPNVDGDVEDLLMLTDDIEAMNRMPVGGENINVPGRDSWQWQGMAGALSDAVKNNADVLAWPSSTEQYKRYFTRLPETLDSFAKDAEADLEQAIASRFMPSTMRTYEHAAQSARAEADQAMGSMNLYKNQYDKKMPRHRRWKQLGLEPKLVDFKNARPKGWSTSSPGDGSRPLGKYWVVELTPETRARLKESGIPYYVMGGAAVLGQEDDGALD